MIRFTSWAVGILAFSASVSAFAQDAEPAAEPSTTEPAAATEAPAADANSGAVAASTDDKKIKLGLRLGYGLPFGSAEDGAKLKDGFSGQIPIWIDAGYMVTPNILVGLYGQYGFVSVKECRTGADCSAHDIRFGVQGQYHLSPAESIDPWLGLGIGYEILSESLSGGGSTADVSFKGFEFLNLQGGADFKVANALSVGPFLSFSLGQYSSEKISGFGAPIDRDGSVDKTALHEWLTLGVKGTFGL